MDFKEIAKKLNDAFEASGLSYGDLSERTGLAKSALHRYLSGDTKKIPIDRMTAICNAIGLDAKEVLGWEIHDDPDAIASARRIPPPGYETPEIALMLKCMSDLSPEDQKRLLDIGRLAFPVAFNKKLEENDK